jgi:excisionase family DNA binding protein
MQAEGAQEMWDRLPRHVQLLVGSHPKEVAQPSYKRFKETREELVGRLLDPTLSLEEAARILNVCPTTVRRYTNKNQLRHLRTAGNQRRFRLSDILTFMEAQTSKKAE